MSGRERQPRPIGGKRRDGVTLVELLVALAISLVVITQLLLAFSSQHESYVEQERVVETQQEARLLTNVILTDLRMAGFMLAREAGVASIDGGAGGSDVLCMSDSSVINSSVYTSTNNRLEGADVTTAITGSNSSLAISSSEQDLDADGDVDFVVGAGILISDGTRVHCARVTSVGSGSVDFTPATPSGVSYSVADTIAVPAVVYAISGSTLTRNGLTLSTQVEDLQVEFGVDTDNDGEITGAEFPIDDLNGEDVAQTRVARIYLTTRTSTGDQDFSGLRARAANRTAGTSDNFKRRRAIADTVLRNMG